MLAINTVLCAGTHQTRNTTEVGRGLRVTGCHVLQQDKDRDTIDSGDGKRAETRRQLRQEDSGYMKTAGTERQHWMTGSYE